MEFLNSKERKLFFSELTNTYNYTGSKDYVVYQKGKSKYYLLSRDVEHVLEMRLRITHAGLYIATRMPDGSMRLSMDGAQIFGEHCEKKHELTKEEKDLWMRGETLFYSGNQEGYVIITWNGNILGCGKCTNNKIVNFVPKERRILEPHP